MPCLNTGTAAGASVGVPGHGAEQSTASLTRPDKVYKYFSICFFPPSTFSPFPQSPTCLQHLLVIKIAFGVNAGLSRAAVALPAL